jgi:hypothetical protein
MAVLLPNAGGGPAIDGITKRGAAQCYLALCKTGVAPTRSWTSTEVIANEVTVAGTNGYARFAVTWTDPGLTNRSANSNNVKFGPFSADLAACGYVVLVDNASGATGTVRYIWDFSANPQNPGLNDSIEFSPGALEITVTSN